MKDNEESKQVVERQAGRKEGREGRLEGEKERRIGCRWEGGRKG